MVTPMPVKKARKKPLLRPFWMTARLDGPTGAASEIPSKTFLMTSFIRVYIRVPLRAIKPGFPLDNDALKHITFHQQV